ncbi:BEN domain-containing protein 3-like [Pecten maximus]|uniref:BEN domain-containing protein 3-like n=1 Tax=Pecten maximus TaxID=6579 RepID=UPI00145878C6|nr:BEN domain-containing protein 3-like [Pecten maximus]
MAMLKEVLSGLTNTNQKITTLERRMASLEGKIDLMVEHQNLRQQMAPAAEISEDEIPIVPADLTIDEEILHGMRCQANSAGNFGKLLCERMFSELFGPGNLRLAYSWNGGGMHQKQELDARRKDVLRKYVQQFYPEVRKHEHFRAAVVTKINEGLRRPVVKLCRRRDVESTHL